MSSYVTSAIAYVNGPPHLGHAFELVLADALARARRDEGRDVFFTTGTDENSLKNVRAAEAAGVETRALVDANAAHFRALTRQLGLSNDTFVRTSFPEHALGVQALWARAEAAHDLERRTYRGRYCVGCEQFFARARADEVCPEHGPLEWVEEENVFFRLSRYTARLTDLIERGALRIVPDKARSEVLATLRGGLEDFSVSRSLARARGWGVPVPGDPSQMVYVWFDALASYLTALGWPSEGELYRRHWRDAEERVHVIGKGITKFHALHWPAMLLSAGLPLPTTLVVHGYLTVEGRKIGKSLGNAVAPAGLVERYGRDALRYALLRHVRPHEDADFRVESFERALESELADQLGNGLQRTLALVERGLDGRRPTRREDGGALEEETASLEAEVRGHVAEVRCDRALEAIFRRVESGNRFLEARAPWRLIPKAGVAATGATRDVLEGILGTSFAALDAVGRALRPFLPEAAEAITTRLRGDDSGRCRLGAPLFPKRRPHVA